LADGRDEGISLGCVVGFFDGFRVGELDGALLVRIVGDLDG